MTYVSPENSRLLYGNKSQVVADGIHAAVVKVRLRDYRDMPVPNKQVEITASRTEGVTIQQPGLTDANGLALAYVRATTDGPVSLSAQVLPTT
jgi:hypothetical protein